MSKQLDLVVELVSNNKDRLSVALIEAADNIVLNNRIEDFYYYDIIAVLQEFSPAWADYIAEHGNQDDELDYINHFVVSLLESNPKYDELVLFIKCENPWGFEPDEETY